MTWDKFGVLVQVQHNQPTDGGDSVAWMGHYLGNKDGLDRYGQKYPYVYFFEVKFGGWVRHPIIQSTNNGFGAHYNGPWDGVISRDQLIGIIRGCSSQREYGAVARIIIHSLAWGGLFTYNTIKNGVKPEYADWKWPDFLPLDVWAMMLRSLGPWSLLFYPILLIIDLNILLKVIYENKKSSKDPISHAGKIIHGKFFWPTPLSLLAYKVCDRKKLMREIENYCNGWRQIPALWVSFKNKL